MHRPSLTRRQAIAGAALLTVLGKSQAQGAADWPTQPVKLLLPFTPGGSDVLFRIMAPKLSEMWKQPVVLEHRPGASNIVATEILVRSKPDGYTLSVTGATLSSNQLFYKRIPYTYDNIAGVSRLVNIEMVVVARNSAPFNTIAEMVDYAKKNPAKLTWGTGGLGATYAGFLHLLNRTGIEMLHVNYTGTPQAHNELMADRIDLVVNPYASSREFVKAGRMKVLAALGPKRIASSGNVPTVSETYPGVEITPYYAFIAPKGTPAAILQKIQRDSATVLRTPDVLKQVADLGLVTIATSPEETDAFFRSETAMWNRVAQQLKLPPPQ